MEYWVPDVRLWEMFGNHAVVKAAFLEKPSYAPKLLGAIESVLNPPRLTWRACVPPPGLLLPFPHDSVDFQCRSSMHAGLPGDPELRKLLSQG